MIEILQSKDLVLLCCEEADAALVCRWVQVKPTVELSQLHGSTVTATQPKTADPIKYTITIPDTLTEHVFTDVEFSLAGESRNPSSNPGNH